MQRRCIECGKEVKVIPARLDIFKFCSYECRGKWRHKYWTGENNPAFTGGPRKKFCQHCGVEFSKPRKRAISVFRTQKFCSKKCSDLGGFRYSGKDHPNYREQARRRNRGGSHHKWVNAVMSRDKATCQHCGAIEIELHAHHIKSYKDYPELRFDVSNGITLCYRCHWELHTALNAKAVNSGNTQTAKAEGNPEPSHRRKLMEGVTTRGRAYRRVVGECDWCKSIYSKPLSDTKGKSALFCSRSCSAKWTRALVAKRKAVISSKNAAPERDEIV